MELAIIVFCLLFSSFFSASETAFLSVNRNRLKAMGEKGNKKALLALALSDDYDRLISTILIGNNIVNIALSSAGTMLFVKLMGSKGATVSTAVITVLVLLFGEITPKSIAKDYPERFATFSAPLLKALLVLFTPLNFIFLKWKQLIGKMFGPSENKTLTQEELLLLVDEVEKEGTIDNSEGTLLKNVIEFTDSKADEILTHRTDIEAVEVGTDNSAVAELFQSTGHSRLPVYSGSLDNIVGIVHQKDLYSAAGLTEVPIEKLMKPPVFVVRTEKISNILKLLQRQKSHICIVVDEYGGTYGLLTMEDILEELVGEIWDEHDVVSEDIKLEEDGSFTVAGLTSLDDLREYFELEIESESVSAGGWVMEMLSRVPEPGDSFEFENLNITVSATDGHRVSELKIVRHIPETDEENTDKKDKDQDKKHDREAANADQEGETEDISESDQDK